MSLGFDGGGVGTSTSNSSPTTYNTDQRVVGGDGSINTSDHIDLTGMTGSYNTVTTTDHGAVAGALQLALAGVEQANDVTKTTIAANGSLLTGALTMAGQQQQAFTDTVANIKTADVRVLIIAGLAVVGLGAAMAFRKA